LRRRLSLQIVVLKFIGQYLALEYLYFDHNMILQRQLRLEQITPASKLFLLVLNLLLDENNLLTTISKILLSVFFIFVVLISLC